MLEIVRSIKKCQTISVKSSKPNRNHIPDAPIVAQNSEKVKHNLNSPTKSTQNSPHIQSLSQSSSATLKTILANFVPVCFPGLDAERLVYKLEAEGIFVSTGAACAANKGTKSHVLAAIGLSDEEIAGSLRISLGSTNTQDQIMNVAPKIVEIVRNEYIRLAERSLNENLFPK